MTLLLVIVLYWTVKMKEPHGFLGTTLTRQHLRQQQVFAIIMLMVLIVALHRETTAQFTETDAKVQALHCLTHSHSPVMQQKNPGAPVS